MKKNNTRKLTERNDGASFYRLSRSYGKAFAVAYLTYDCFKERNRFIKATCVGHFLNFKRLMGSCYWSNIQKKSIKDERKSHNRIFYSGNTRCIYRSINTKPIE